MEFLLKKIEQVLKIQKRWKTWQKIVAVLACFTVAVTTYALILPAITLNQNTAKEKGGIVLEENADIEPEEAASANEMQPGSEQTENAEEESPEITADGTAETTVDGTAETTAGGTAETAADARQNASDEAAVLTGITYPESLNVRAEKRKDADVLETLSQGTNVKILEDQGDGWLFVSTPGGQSGFVKAAYVLLPGETVEQKKPAMTFEMVADKDSPDAEISEAYIDGTFSRPITVHVEAPVGAFPAGTTMKVRPIAEEQVREAVESVIPKSETVNRVSAVDITFIDVCGDEIEPDKEIKVSLTSEDIPSDQESVVVHVDNEGQAQMVETKKEEENVVFESDKFSVYVVVGTETVTVDYLTDEGTTYEISVDVSGISNLPANASLDIHPVTGARYEEYKAKAVAAIGARASEVTYANLLDISIVDEDGNTFQPQDGETVKVEIKLKDKEESAETQIVHFGEQTEILDAVVSTDTVSFETTGFSIYAIIGTDESGHKARVKYVFQNADGTPYKFTNTAGETVDNQIIKNGESLENVGIPAINPDGQTFNGWYLYSSEGLTGNKVSFYPTTISISTGASTTNVTSTSVAVSDEDNTFEKEGAEDPSVDYTVYVRPSYGPVYYLTFWNEVNGQIIYTKIQIPADANVYDISQQEAIPPDAIVDPETGEVVEYVTYAFTGWSTTPGTYEAMTDNSDTRSEITDTTITVTGDMEFYPIFKRAHWINFHTAETGSGATYVPPVYIQSGEQASTKKPADPTWEGHTFVGWFTTEDDDPLSSNEIATGSFNWNQTLNEDTTLYAHWNAGTANYTIVYWRQLVTDNKNASNANKHYEYAGQENKIGQVTRSVTPGTVVNVPVGYQINTAKSDSSTTVLADGTAVLNVYLDRKLITMNFGTQTRPKRYGTYTGLYGQTLVQNGYHWPSDYGWQYKGTSRNYSMSYLGEFVLPVNRITGANDTVTEINFWYVDADKTIYYYLQNEDGSWPTEYIDAGETSADTIQIPEKFTGFTMDAYQYSNRGRGGNYSPGTWISVSPNDTEKDVKDGMAIRYRRLNYTIKFLDSRNGTELADVPAISVPFGRTLASYKPTVTEITPPSNEYEWTGKWYADQDCTTEFDWSQSMPSHDIAVYVNWNENWYWIKVDPDGGEFKGTEATWFWEPIGGVVEEYHNVTKSYVEDPKGTWYYHYDEFNESDPDGTQPSTRKAYYTQDAKLSTDGKTYSEDPKAYSLVGWYEVDQETGELKGLYDFEGGATGNTIIRAVWRTVGQYRVQYSTEGVNEDGTPLYVKDESGAETDKRVVGDTAPTDNNKYADKSNSAIGAAIGVEPDGYVFTGWYYNGKMYNPGDKFIIMSELDVTDLDEDKDDTITIYPVFVKYEDLPVKTTHIYWYGNTVDNTGTAIEGVTSANEPKDETTHENLQVNKAIDIKSVTSLPNVSTLYTGYKFKGWAKLDESTPNSTAVTPWLIWDEDSETYTVDGVSGVTQIAADELLSPMGEYEKLVAVWEKEKYSVTVVKDVESSLSGDQDISFTFTPSFPAGLGTDVQTNFSLSGNSDPKVFNDGNADNPQTKFVPYKSTFSITEQLATGFDLTSVTGEYKDDDGVKHTIDNLSNGAEIEVLGDTVITFKNTRQLVDVVVKKTLVNPYIASTDGVDFSFTATWGTDGSANFTVNNSNADGYRIEDVPVGAEMVITEVADDAYEYTVTAAGTNSRDTDEVENTYTFEVPAADETVTFTNTVVTVDGINVTKTDDKTPAKGLSGAEFTLARNNKLDGSGNSWIAVAGPYSGTLTSGANGVLISAGTLPVGTYKLTEGKAPDGYMITKSEVVFTVSEGEEGALITKVSGDDASVSDDGKTLTIINRSGQELPTTGGPGALPYTLGGLMLFIASALMYGFRMRRRERRLN